jgi:CBS-domain-containing membrane protein
MTRRDIALAAAPALLSALVISLVGALGIAARQPWLFPSLGPTVFLLTANAADPAARPWNILVGHAIGACAGFGALFFCGAQETPSVFAADAVSISRAAATALAVGATMLLQSKAGAMHPPAAATTMLITLGGMKPAWSTIVAIAVGVMLAAGLGYAARAALGGSPNAEE